MKIMRCIKVICLILPAMYFAGCNDSYGDFFNDPDNTGEAQWATPMKAAPSTCIFAAVAVDKSGNTYAVGYVLGSTGGYEYGGDSDVIYGSYGYNNPVVVKYNSLGVAQWAKTIESSSGESMFNAVGVDDSGNVYAVGSVNGTGEYRFGGISSPVIGQCSGDNTVIVKYDSNGVAQWAKSVEKAPVGANIWCVFHGVAVDAAGNSYAVGEVGYPGATKQYSFGGMSTPIELESDLGTTLIVKYNSSGIAQWATGVKSAMNQCAFKKVAIDRSGNAYAVGYVEKRGSIFFGGNINVNGKNNEISSVIVKYNAEGIAQWAKSTKSGDGDNQFSGVAVDRSGNAYAVGYVMGVQKIEFGDDSESFSGKGFQTAAIVKYNSSGTVQWATPIRDMSAVLASSSFAGVAVDVLGNPYAVGFVSQTGSFDFGGNSIKFNIPNDSSHAVIVKYDSFGIAQWATPNNNPSTSNFLGIAVDHSGYAYAVGSLNASVYGDQYDFGGKSHSFPAPSNVSSTVIVKYY